MGSAPAVYYFDIFFINSRDHAVMSNHGADACIEILSGPVEILPVVNAVLRREWSENGQRIPGMSSGDNGVVAGCPQQLRNLCPQCATTNFENRLMTKIYQNNSNSTLMKAGRTYRSAFSIHDCAENVEKPF